MNRSYFTSVSAFFVTCITLLISLSSLQAQDLRTSNTFITAIVENQTGLVTVLLPPGRVGRDPQLDFQDKSFLTCQIGTSFFTNNQVIPLQKNAALLSDGTSIKIGDTIRTTWLNKNGVDIIQDIYPVAFTKSGQIVYKWKFLNNAGAAIAIACQYLNDIQITDPNSAGMTNTNDGPKILTKWQYTGNSVQYPNAKFTSVPPFYVGFLHDLPNAPSMDPGLNCQAWLDNSELGLIPPFRMTVNDWFQLAQTLFGANSQSISGASIGGDNAVLLEFSAKTVEPGKETEIGRTSYGTGEFEKCIGNLVGLSFYPHRINWNWATRSSTPNPFAIDFFAVDGGNVDTAGQTHITLTTGDHLSIVSDIAGTNSIGKSQTLPALPSPGVAIPPGEVSYFQWFVKADSGFACTDDVTSTLTFTGSSSLGSPTFVNTGGQDECDQSIVIQCPATAGVGTMISSAPITLEANHPNPFSRITTFSYTIGSSGATRIILFDELGREAARIFEGMRETGAYSVDFDGSKLPAGSYIIRLENGGRVASQKVIIER
ncbi:MAG: T9SS type A sorting domain-containing protein [Bacteroidota bacterium]|nr:T9SS type A sorting domain-containing protein [Bacteroidota bacterium]MDP4237608.1 T9SS type A sorting domain-containing protein [Bacteroidota bacterium]